MRAAPGFPRRCGLAFALTGSRELISTFGSVPPPTVESGSDDVLTLRLERPSGLSEKERSLAGDLYANSGPNIALGPISDELILRQVLDNLGGDLATYSKPVDWSQYVERLDSATSTCESLHDELAKPGPNGPLSDGGEVGVEFSQFGLMIPAVASGLTAWGLREMLSSAQGKAMEMAQDMAMELAADPSGSPPPLTSGDFSDLMAGALELLNFVVDGDVTSSDAEHPADVVSQLTEKAEGLLASVGVSADLRSMLANAELWRPDFIDYVERVADLALAGLGEASSPSGLTERSRANMLVRLAFQELAGTVAVIAIIGESGNPSEEHRSRLVSLRESIERRLAVSSGGRAATHLNQLQLVAQVYAGFGYRLPGQSLSFRILILQALAGVRSTEIEAGVFESLVGDRSDLALVDLARGLAASGESASVAHGYLSRAAWTMINSQIGQQYRRELAFRSIAASHAYRMAGLLPTVEILFGGDGDDPLEHLSDSDLPQMTLALLNVLKANEDSSLRSRLIGSLEARIAKLGSKDAEVARKYMVAADVETELRSGKLRRLDFYIDTFKSTSSWTYILSMLVAQVHELGEDRAELVLEVTSALSAAGRGLLTPSWNDLLLAGSALDAELGTEVEDRALGLLESGLHRVLQEMSPTFARTVLDRLLDAGVVVDQSRLVEFGAREVEHLAVSVFPEYQGEGAFLRIYLQLVVKLADYGLTLDTTQNHGLGDLDSCAGLLARAAEIGLPAPHRNGEPSLAFVRACACLESAHIGGDRSHQSLYEQANLLAEASLDVTISRAASLTTVPPRIREVLVEYFGDGIGRVGATP